MSVGRICIVSVVQKVMHKGVYMKQKKVYLELLRVLAIVLVIYNHTRSDGYTLYQNTNNVWTYYSSLVLSIFCKVAVPLFFMISGVTLLGKKETIRIVYRKRVLRMVLIILLFTFLQYLRLVRVNPENGFSIVTYLAYCYSGNIIEPYWFLKSYLSMLLILPLLRILAQNMKREHFYLLLGIRIMSTLITVIQFRTGYSMNVTLLTNTDFVFYPLMGYYLDCMELGERKGGWRMAYCCLATMVLLVFNVIIVTVYYQTNGQYSEALNTVMGWMVTLLVFMCFKEIRLSDQRVRKFWTQLGECTFGLYLIEDVVRNQIEKMMPWIRPVCGPMTACLIFVLLSTVTGLVVIWLVRRLPYVKKLI